MVKLDFNPKKEKSNEVLESKTSKINIKSSKTTVNNIVIKEKNLNPFKDVFTEVTEVTEVKENENFYLSCKNIVGLENCHYVLKEWFYGIDFKPLLIIGPTGCGKTTLINSFCREENIKLLDLKINDNKTKKDILKEIDLFIDYSADNFFLKFAKVKKLILIDEYQNGTYDLISTVDILSLKDKSIHVVIISSDSKGSKLSEFKKSCEVYYINEIPQGIVKTWIILINKNLSEIQINYLLKNCKSDKRLILNILDFINNNNENSKLENIDTFLQYYHKDVDINLFEFIKQLFDNIDPVNIKDTFKIYDNDGFILSNLIHENYIDYNQDIHRIAKAAESISYGEILFSDTYESNKSFLPDFHCVNSIIIPSYYSRCDVPNKGLSRSSIINNRFNILLNNKKIINKINGNNLNKLDIFDIYLFKNILNQELIKSKVQQNGKIQFVKSILQSITGENSLERLELIYKHFNDFKEHNTKEVKTKNFTLKFKEKLK